MKKYVIFDFDDTLVSTDAKVIVKGPGGTKELTAGEFAKYEPHPEDKFDVSQFEKTLINPKPIQKYTNFLRRLHGRTKGINLMILTARGNAGPVAKYLRSIGITSGVKLVALGNANPQAKANYIEKLIANGAEYITFYDDSEKNIAAVKVLKSKYPNVTLNAQLVKP